MLWILAAATLLGLVLLALGLRGRVVGDEPRCRACRFDLSGLDLAPAEAVCPECGHPLASPRAIRTGRRVRSRRLGVTGLVLALLPLGLAIPIATGQWTKWNTSKPVWVLSLDTDLGSPSIQSAALDELLRREMAGELDAAGARTLLHARAAQFEYAKSLDLSDLPLLEAAHKDGRLSDRRWQKTVLEIDRFAQTYADLFAVPETWGLVRTDDGRLEGESLSPVTTAFDGPSGGLGMLFLIDLNSMTIDGESVDPDGPANTPRNNVRWYQADSYRVLSKGGRSSSSMKFAGHPAPRFDSPRNPLRDLPPGEYDLTTAWALRPFVGGSIGRSSVGKDALETAIPLTPRTFITTTHVTIVRNSPDLIEQVSDPERLAGARADFSFRAVQENTWGRRAGDPPGMAAFNMDYGWSGSGGAQIAHIGHLEIEWGGVRVRPDTDTQPGSTAPPVARHAMSSGSGGFGRAWRVAPPTPRPKTVTLILVPDLETAPDYAGPWLAEHGTPMPTVAGEIRWEGIPIEWITPDEDAPTTGVEGP